MERPMGLDGDPLRCRHRVARRVAPGLCARSNGDALGHSHRHTRCDARTGAILQDVMRRAICLILLAASPCIATERQILSKVYTIDRKYRSMEGPSSLQKIVLGSNATPELLWITGIRTEMVAEDGTTPQLPELMCHVNVDLDSNAHQALFNLPRPTAARLMTLSQGMLSAKVPAGYGFPIASNEPLLLFTQVLNHNIEHPDNLKVRHRVTIDYVRDADLSEPMKPLFNVGASGMVQLDNNPLALATMMPTSADGSATH